jgi:DNA mismatch repair protein MutL
MTGRYAVAFLFLDMPADLVDVNVHPTKMEVRFREGQWLHSFVLKCVRQRLSAANLTPRLHTPTAMAEPRLAPVVIASPVSSREFSLALDRTEPSALAWSPSAAPAQSPENSGSSPQSEQRPANADTNPQLRANTPILKAIQLHNAYLVLETLEGMLVVDQHALHERILFEQLKRRIQAGTLEVQQLLIPEPVDLPPDHAARALEHRAALAELGLGIQDFGGGTVLLSSYPALLGNSRPLEILKAVLDHVCSNDRLPGREQLFRDLLALMACHAAVRSGDALTPEEIAALLAQRQFADDTHHCPHGRPTSLLFTRHDLDRQFRRI